MDKLERQIAMETEAGREGLRVWQQTLRDLPPERRIMKAFELTEMARQAMKAGLRAQHPDASEQTIQELYVDRLLGHHGLSLQKIRQLQAQAS